MFGKTGKEVTHFPIGELRHRLAFQTLALSSDGQGGYTEQWTTTTTLWGALLSASAAERLFAQKLEPLITHRIVIRYNSAITSDMRVLFDGRTFQIKAPYNYDERNIYTVMDAIEDSNT